MILPFTVYLAFVSEIGDWDSRVTKTGAECEVSIFASQSLGCGVRVMWFGVEEFGSVFGGCSLGLGIWGRMAGFGFRV